jgi:hypothetical protein
MYSIICDDTTYILDHTILSVGHMGRGYCP